MKLFFFLDTSMTEAPHALNVKLNPVSDKCWTAFLITEERI